MPKIYLSPSTQEYNPYVTGAGSEESFMNLLACMEPILLLNGIQFSRNTPDMTAASSIRQANAGQYDFYLALHSNASGPGAEGGAGAFSPSTIPPAPTAAGRRSCSWKTSGTSTPCRRRCPHGPPPLWERSASPGSPRCCWSLATTITPTMPCGSRRISPASPPTWC